MRFLPDQDHLAYTSTVRRLLEDSTPVKAARAWAAGDHAPGRALWRALADTGLPALAVPEEAGGLGWYPPELAAAFVEIGRAAAPGPLVETVALTAALHDGKLLTGEHLATVTDPAAGYAVDAHAADAVYTLTPTPPPTLHAATPTGPALPSVDPTRHLARCTLGDPVAADTRRLSDLCTLLTAAQLLGLGRALLDSSVEYVRHRKQFGRPVGSFQAVKHQLADAAVGLEFAQPLLHGAALAVRGDAAADPRDLPAAKAACSQAALTAARTALQVHGAIGYTDEYDVSLLLRKARALAQAWGTTKTCHEAVLAAP
ncbi:acyl-CoA dehydrogenase [Streptomyces albus]|uniref:acyl-CoA dehydrogenase n=1 Tax=Streptomyces albus TaxID=1888 RepID=UPI003410E4F3